MKSLRFCWWASAVCRSGCTRRKQQRYREVCLTAFLLLCTALLVLPGCSSFHDLPEETVPEASSGSQLPDYPAVEESQPQTLSPEQTEGLPTDAVPADPPDQAVADPGPSAAGSLTDGQIRLNSGYMMPANGLGTYSLTGETAYNAVRAALDSGVRLIDTAYMYHNEEEIGRAIRDSGVPRSEIFVTTKLYPGTQYENAEQAIDEALSRLDIGYIDLLLLHHPGENDVQAYKAMEEAAAQGKIRSLGLSNWYIEELQEFLPQIRVMPAVVQNEIHPYYQEQEVVPYIQRLGIVTEGWYPLGGRGYTKEMLSDPVLTQIAAAHGKSAAQIILRWNLQRGIVVIPGSSNPAHILENTQLYDFELSPQEMAAIGNLDRGEKHDWY